MSPALVVYGNNLCIREGMCCLDRVSRFAYAQYKTCNITSNRFDPRRAMACWRSRYIEPLSVRSLKVCRFPRRKAYGRTAESFRTTTRSESVPDPVQKLPTSAVQIVEVLVMAKQH